MPRAPQWAGDSSSGVTCLMLTSICCCDRLQHPPSDPQKGRSGQENKNTKRCKDNWIPIPTNTPHYQYLIVYWLFYCLMSIALIDPFQFWDLDFQLNFHSKQQISSTYQHNLILPPYIIYLQWYWRGTMWHTVLSLYPAEQFTDWDGVRIQINCSMHNVFTYFYRRTVYNCMH